MQSFCLSRLPFIQLCISHQILHNTSPEPDMIFVNFFTRPAFLRPKFYPEKRVNRDRVTLVGSYCKVPSKRSMSKQETDISKRERFTQKTGKFSQLLHSLLNDYVTTHHMGKFIHNIPLHYRFCVMIVTQSLCKYRTWLKI